MQWIQYVPDLLIYNLPYLPTPELNSPVELSCLQTGTRYCISRGTEREKTQTTARQIQEPDRAEQIKAMNIY